MSVKKGGGSSPSEDLLLSLGEIRVNYRTAGSPRGQVVRSSLVRRPGPGTLRGGKE